MCEDGGTAGSGGIEGRGTILGIGGTLDGNLFDVNMANIEELDELDGLMFNLNIQDEAEVHNVIQDNQAHGAERKIGHQHSRIIIWLCDNFMGTGNNFTIPLINQRITAELQGPPVEQTIRNTVDYLRKLGIVVRVAAARGNQPAQYSYWHSPVEH